MYEEDFARRLAQLRVKKGVSARDMSLSIGQNPGYINTIENGKAFPTMVNFFYICEFLGVTPQECIFFDDSVKSCRSAKASGMTVIGVYDPFFEGTKDEMPLVCDRFIRDFGEML